MTMAGALSVTPVRPNVRTSVRTYVHVLTYVRLSQRRPVSKSNTFDQNFMKQGRIV